MMVLLRNAESGPYRAAIAHAGLKAAKPKTASECLTELSDLVKADEGAAERGESEVDVIAALVADSQATELGQPRQRALDYPATAAEALATLCG